MSKRKQHALEFAASAEDYLPFASLAPPFGKPHQQDHPRPYNSKDWHGSHQAPHRSNQVSSSQHTSAQKCSQPPQGWTAFTIRANGLCGWP